MARKPVGIVTDEAGDREGIYYVFCDDGTVWRWDAPETSGTAPQWTGVPPSLPGSEDAESGGLDSSTA